MGVGIVLNKASDSTNTTKTPVWGWPPFPIKGHIINISGFAGHIVFYTVAQAALNSAVPLWCKSSQRPCP